eukprot:TRINITY_DN611_c0_g1_i1.p1 TRINITY_DN611_c0_g1~~TRINITY_DN611_c0_g1_i1.p1  ORF type:complete len:763 (+),score=184.50 TRINITY_DN611_c0_g1_i1:104-2392(+)
MGRARCIAAAVAVALLPQQASCAMQGDRSLRQRSILSTAAVAPSRLRGQRRRGSTLDVAPSECSSGIKVTGVGLAQVNGVYLRDNDKVVNGKETYWLASNEKFWYYCSQDNSWKINWGQWYGDESKIGADNCYYVAYADAEYPTAPAADWWAWSKSTGVIRQQRAAATCVASCDVADGSGPASTYPCKCGTATCSAEQACDAGGKLCAECNQLQISGIDDAGPAGWNERVDGVYSRDNCKKVDGRETYWHSSGNYYIYFCGKHNSWGISVQQYTDYKTQGGARCLVKVDGSDNAPYPTMVSQWWAWANHQWHALEADWHTTITCPATAFEAPSCVPTVAPTLAPVPVPSTAAPLAPDATADPTAAPVQPVTAPPSAGPTFAPIASAGCPGPGALASVVYSGGEAVPSSIMGAANDWLPGESAELLWPDRGTDWLRCGVMYRLGNHRKVPRGSSVQVTCKAPVCDMYLFTYHNPGYSSGFNGGLPAILPGNGWAPASCAPQFRFTRDQENCRHNMVAHRKQIQQQVSDVITIDTEIDAMYAVLVVVSGSDCGVNWRDDRATCLEVAQGASASSCHWLEGSNECVDRWCPRRFGLTQSPDGSLVPITRSPTAPDSTSGPASSPTGSPAGVATGSPVQAATGGPVSGASGSPIATTAQPSAAPATSDPSAAPATSDPSAAPLTSAPVGSTTAPGSGTGSPLQAATGSPVSAPGATATPLSPSTGAPGTPVTSAPLAQPQCPLPDLSDPEYAQVTVGPVPAGAQSE